jgi:outer membrane biosynthesis protein TonB
MNRFVLTTVALLAMGSAAVWADETNFPSRHRTLETSAPAECRDWVAPLPERRVKVELPRDARTRQGSAQLTITIEPDGRYGGLVDALTNDEAFVRAAQASLQYWSFTPARCNGAPVSIQARIYFNFREESFVSYTAASHLR